MLRFEFAGGQVTITGSGTVSVEASSQSEGD